MLQNFRKTEKARKLIFSDFGDRRAQRRVLTCPNGNFGGHCPNLHQVERKRMLCPLLSLRFMNRECYARRSRGGVRQQCGAQIIFAPVEFSGAFFKDRVRYGSVPDGPNWRSDYSLMSEIWHRVSLQKKICMADISRTHTRSHVHVHPTSSGTSSCVLFSEYVVC